MQVIHKYYVPKLGLNKVDMPLHAEILSCGEQNGSLVIWAYVNTDEPLEKRQILTVFTGEDNFNLAAEYRKFIGTVQLYTGIVVHVFDKDKL